MSELYHGLQNHKHESKNEKYILGAFAPCLLPAASSACSNPHPSRLSLDACDPYIIAWLFAKKLNPQDHARSLQHQWRYPSIFCHNRPAIAKLRGQVILEALLSLEIHGYGD